MYNRKPTISISNDNVINTQSLEILNELSKFDKIAIECYPGTNYQDLESRLLTKFTDYTLVLVDKYATSKYEDQIANEMTNDRVFGVMTRYTIDQFYDVEEIRSTDEKVIYYGFGASLIDADTLIYMDLARWEIQKRFRNGLSNWNIKNNTEDILKKFKRGYFFEWRMADRCKKSCIDEVNFFLDMTNKNEQPKLIDAEQIREGLKKCCKVPFRLVPFFDPSVWGGTWMEENCDLPPIDSQYGWSFDGVPEENSILLKFGSDTIELPAMTLVKYLPKELLGPRTYHRFGDEFPIRFDFLDTINGQNLSLQVHPLVEYIQEQFNMNYTQDESYYILDANQEENPCVYLGFKTGVDKTQFIADLKTAANGGAEFNADLYINKVSVKTGDHLLIPAGTVHCSGKGTMILEISATPYIFTFKLWDWGRVGLDGLPRPTHIEHGEKVINFDAQTDYVNNELVNSFKQISNCEEQTGLHATQFIETRRFKTGQSIVHATNNEFQMLNLVSGDSIKIISPSGEFEDYIINFAETFIIPAGVSEYKIIPQNGEVTYIKAYVRT